jgi:integrase
MGIETKKIKSGTRYRANWRNPFTQNIDKGPWVEDRGDAERLNDLMKFRLKYEREYFAPTEGTPSNWTVAILLHRYIDEGQIKEGDRGAKSHITAMVKAIGSKLLEEVTPELMRQVEAFMTSGAGKVRQNTFSRRVTFFRQVLNWGVSQGYIKANPLDFYKCSPGADKKFHPPTPSEAAFYYANAADHVKRVIVGGFYFGTRVGPSELFKLNWIENFDLERGIVMFESAKKGNVDAEDNPIRRVKIKSSILPKITAWYEKDLKKGIPWFIHWHGQPIKSINKAWQGLKEKARKENVRLFRPYDLRHAFATYAIEAGADDNTIAELMGLKSTKMIHTHYQWVLDPMKSKAIENIPDMPLDDEPKTRGTDAGYTEGINRGTKDGFPYPENQTKQ